MSVRMSVQAAGFSLLLLVLCAFFYFMLPLFAPMRRQWASSGSNSRPELQAFRYYCCCYCWKEKKGWLTGRVVASDSISVNEDKAVPRCPEPRIAVAAADAIVVTVRLSVWYIYIYICSCFQNAGRKLCQKSFWVIKPKKKKAIQHGWLDTRLEGEQTAVDFGSFVAFKLNFF